MPAGKTVARVTYDANGTTRWFKKDDTLGGEIAFSIKSAAVPNLRPNVTDLVMLPMPIRTRDHVYATVRNRASSREASSDEDDVLRTIVADENGTQQNDPMNWNEEDVLRLVVALRGQHAVEMRNVIGRRFFAKGDRRLGFYTLLTANGQKWDTEKPVQLGDGTATRMSPLADYPNSPLARYLESEIRETPPALWADWHRNGESKNNFISQFTEFQRLCMLWHPFRTLSDDAETLHHQIQRAFEFI